MIYLTIGPTRYCSSTIALTSEESYDDSFNESILCSRGISACPSTEDEVSPFLSRYLFLICYTLSSPVAKHLSCQHLHQHASIESSILHGCPYGWLLQCCSQTRANLFCFAATCQSRLSSSWGSSNVENSCKVWKDSSGTGCRHCSIIKWACCCYTC